MFRSAIAKPWASELDPRVSTGKLEPTVAEKMDKMTLALLMMSELVEPQDVSDFANWGGSRVAEVPVDDEAET